MKEGAQITYDVCSEIALFVERTEGTSWERK